MISATRALPRSGGFPPASSEHSAVLILGSLPGQKSLEAGQYYAQAQNSFWRIMGRLFGAGPGLEYDARMERLREHRVAVWDVIASARRAGSLDTAIVPGSVVVNAFQPFFEAHREIRLVCFNGRKAADLYARKVLPTLGTEFAALGTRLLPSTSPANASLGFEGKLAAWSDALAGLRRRKRRA